MRNPPVYYCGYFEHLVSASMFGACNSSQKSLHGPSLFIWKCQNELARSVACNVSPPDTFGVVCKIELYMKVR
jgi:hypothetical protein